MDLRAPIIKVTNQKGLIDITKQKYAIITTNQKGVIDILEKYTIKVTKKKGVIKWLS